MYKISVTTIDQNGSILSHRIARGEKYYDLIKILEEDAIQMDLSTLRDGPVSKRHTTGNTTFVLLVNK